MRASDIIGTDKKGDEVLPLLVEVGLKQDNFLQVKESLMRIGIPGKPDETGKPSLHQTCHILFKQGKYYICHFKSLFVLDGKNNTLVDSDIARQNTIIKLLQDWDMIKVKNPDMIVDPICSLKTLKVVKHKDRNDWKFVSRYDIGRSVRRTSAGQ